MAVVHATDQTFEQEIQGGMVLVDFWAPWCGPCQMLSPVLDELAEELDGEVKIVKVNVDENPVISQALEVMSIPTMYLIKDGKGLAKTGGFMPKEVLLEFINDYK